MTTMSPTTTLKTFKLDGFTFQAEECVDGVLINPKLPKAFDNTPNESRPASHQKWWFRPFIIKDTIQERDAVYAHRTDEYADKGREHWQQTRPQWLAKWPTGENYSVCCLNGGAWDRSSWLGIFATKEEAIAKASLHHRPVTNGRRRHASMPPFLA